VRPGFVDCHSHVVPSGDDGARSIADGIELCYLAAAGGTEILYATPHIWPHLTLVPEREERIVEAYETIRERTPLELRLGYELTPAAALLDEDPRRYALGGTDVVLMEVPFTGPARPLIALAEHVEAAGLVPLIAHPERTEVVHEHPELPRELAERGWRIQVNASSLLGRHGEETERLAWEIVEGGYVDAVASDGHRVTRPARVDEAHELLRTRVGEEAAWRLVDGSALSARPIPSREAAHGA
jgi:protein-tyrosine phosphatase